MQELNQKMKVRIDALIAVEKALLPGFCEEMACDNTCPMWIDKENPSVNGNCAWCNATHALTILSWKAVK